MNNQSANTPGLTANANPDELLDKRETADRLKISTRTLDLWMREGRVSYLKISKTVRFRWGDVIAHLTHNCRVN